MKENVVQWVLLRRTEFLARCLGLPLRRKLAEYQTTDYGIIDFAFDTTQDEVAIVELETEIASSSKLEFCIEQSVRYKGLASLVSQRLRVFILYDELGTPPQFVRRLTEQSVMHGLELRTYSMLDIKTLYQSAMEHLEKTSGVYLGRPVATNMTHLRLLNRFLLPFLQRSVDALPIQHLFHSFTSSSSRTIFNVRKNIAEHFELIRITEKNSSSSSAELTPYGKRFCEGMTYGPLSTGHEFDLSHSQRQVLLDVLTNGHSQRVR